MKTNLSKQFVYFCLTVLITLGISISVQSLLAAWSNPTANPPGSNLSEPINVSSVAQGRLGNFGIGTTTPNAKLNIYDSSSGPLISIQGLNTNYRGLKIANTANIENWFAGSNNSNNFVVRRNGGTDDITIASSTGNVGIGDTSPAATLTVGNEDKFQVAGTSGNITTAGSLTVNGVATVSEFSGALSVKGAGTSAKGLTVGSKTLILASTTDNLIYGNISASSVSGSNLMLLQNNDTTKFKVDKDGNVTAIKFAGDGSGLTNVAASTATSATTATNLAGGSAGTIPYQSAANTTTMLGVGTSGQFLKSNGAAAPSWAAVGGSGTVTSLSQGTGILLSSNPITTSGTISLATNYQDGSVYDSRFVNVSGDIMTGDLIVSGFKLTTGAQNNYILTSDSNGVGTWKAAGTVIEVDGIIGNEVTDATNSTLTRGGSGTSVSPYTLGLNLTNANTWSGIQTFSSASTFSSNPTFSGLTAGSVLFAGTNGLLSQDNANLFWNSSNKRLGIGIATPNQLLHVYKTTSGDDNAEIDIQSVLGTNKHWGIYQDRGTEALRFWQGDNRMTILANGNVGIGTITPVTKLEVSGGVECPGAGIATSTGDRITTYSDTTWRFRQGVEGNHMWFAITNKDAVPSDDFGFKFYATDSNATPVAYMVIKGTGNVGIGDTSPAATLTVGNEDKFQVAGATGNITTAGSLTVNGVATVSEFSGALSVKGAGTSAKGLTVGSKTLILASTTDNLIYGNISASSVSGSNLMLLQNNDTTKFKVDKDGNVTAIKFAGDGSGLTNVTATDNTKVLKTGDTITGTLNITGIFNANIDPTASVGGSGAFYTTSPTTAYPGGIAVMKGGNTATAYSGGAGGRITTYGADYNGYGSGLGGNINLTVGKDGATGNGRLYIDDYANNHLVTVQTTNGNVGIGTTAPGNTLDVNGGISVGTSVLDSGLTQFVVKRGQTNNLLSYSANSDKAIINYYQNNYNNDYTRYLDIVAIGASTKDSNIRFITSQSDMNGTEKVRITSSGNVGIGTTAPGAKLDVAGQIKITGGSPGLNKVLTSDANGLASWVTSTTLPAGTSGQTLRYDGTNSLVANGVLSNDGTNITISGDLAVNGGDITSTGTLTVTAGGTNKNVTLTPSGTGYTILNGNVGIGTTAPQGLLDVNGTLTVLGKTVIPSSVSCINPSSCCGAHGCYGTTVDNIVDKNFNTYWYPGDGIAEAKITYPNTITGNYQIKYKWSGDGYFPNCAGKISISTDNTNWTDIVNGAASTIQTYSGNTSFKYLKVKIPSSGSCGWVSIAEILVYSNEPFGNVGIGTTAPSEKLHIQDGGIKLTSGGPSYTISINSSGMLEFKNDAGDVKMSLDQTGILKTTNITSP